MYALYLFKLRRITVAFDTVEIRNNAFTKAYISSRNNKSTKVFIDFMQNI